MMETIQDVLQLILQADDIKYVKNSGILNYGLDLKQVVEREIELSVCKGDKEILLAMNYDIEQCSVQFQIVDCTEEEEKKIIDLDFALNGAETAVDFTQALNLYLLSIGYIDELNRLPDHPLHRYTVVIFVQILKLEVTQCFLYRLLSFF